MTRNHLFAAMLAAALPCVAVADTIAPGQLDPTFGIEGRRTVAADLDVSAPLAVTTVKDPGGRLYSVGTFNSPQPLSIAITRLTEDGDIDTQFGDQGTVTHTVGASPAIARDAVFDPQGRLIVIGNASVDGVESFLACRFDQDGIPDITFGSPTTPGCTTVPGAQGIGEAEAVAIQPCLPEQECIDDQRIVLAGAIGSNGQRLGIVLGLKSDGSELDQNFGLGGFNVVPLAVTARPTHFLAVDSNAAGELVAAGYKELEPTDRDFLAFRLDGDGLADTAFNASGVRVEPIDLDVMFRVDEAHAVHLFEDGSVLLAGSAQAGPLSHRVALQKIDATGLDDATFTGGGDGVQGSPGEVTYDLCGETCDMRTKDLEMLPDGRILIAGPIAAGVDGDTNLDLARKSDMFALRLQANGTPDATFRSPGAAAGLAIVPFDLVDGQSQDIGFSLIATGERIVLAGTALAPDANDDGFDDHGFALARLGNGTPIFRDGFED